MFAVLTLSLLPISGTGANDKVLHLLTYAILAGWFSLLAKDRRALLGYALGLVIFGASIEGLQAMTSYRFAEWLDLLANSTGVMIGCLLYLTPGVQVLHWFDKRLANLLR